MVKIQFPPFTESNHCLASIVHNRHMSISLKKIITSLVLLIVFLSPLSIQINIPTSTESLLPVVEILENSALALGRDCPGVTESGSTIACNIGDVFLGYFELIWFFKPLHNILQESYRTHRNNPFVPMTFW